MKSRLEKVYNKLPNQKKVSLSSIKELERASELLTVDSNNFNELERGFSIGNDFDNTLKTALNEATRFIEAYNFITSTYDGVAASNYSEIQTILRDFENKADEIGIDISGIQLYNDLDAQAEDLLEFSKNYTEFVSEYEKTYEQAISIVDFRL